MKDPAPRRRRGSRQEGRHARGRRRLRPQLPRAQGLAIVGHRRRRGPGRGHAAVAVTARTRADRAAAEEIARRLVPCRDQHRGPGRRRGPAVRLGHDDRRRRRRGRRSRPASSSTAACLTAEEPIRVASAPTRSRPGSTPTCRPDHRRGRRPLRLTRGRADPGRLPRMRSCGAPGGIVRPGPGSAGALAPVPHVPSERDRPGVPGCGAGESPGNPHHSRLPTHRSLGQAEPSQPSGTVSRGSAPRRPAHATVRRQPQGHRCSQARRSSTVGAARAVHRMRRRCVRDRRGGGSTRWATTVRRPDGGRRH